MGLAASASWSGCLSARSSSAATCSAMRDWTSNTSSRVSSNLPDHMWRSSETRMSCGVTRTRLPCADFSQRTLPSRMYATPSSRPISLIDLSVLRYCSALVREITPKVGIMARRLVISSVIPSAK